MSYCSYSFFKSLAIDVFLVEWLPNRVVKDRCAGGLNSFFITAMQLITTGIKFFKRVLNQEELSHF